MDLTNNKKTKVILFNGNDGSITEEYVNTNEETFGEDLRDLIFTENFKLYPQNKKGGRHLTTIPYPFVNYVVTELITLKLNKDLSGLRMYGDDCGLLRRWDNRLLVEGTFGDRTVFETLMGSLVLVGISVDDDGYETFTDLELERKHYTVYDGNGLGHSITTNPTSQQIDDFFKGVN